MLWTPTPDTPIDTIGGDGAYDNKASHAEIAARVAQPAIPPRDGAKPWSESTSGAVSRSGAEACAGSLSG
ncbi:hypothetical protein CBM2633_P270013 [Cupriavidus taiwanensis]|nr:hypothetical protein CBM2617_P300012 [Cupriavidus taiwanensis]SPA23325.1 hypothetical protein CBM2633_P270013 [Cupriavidus taiwanensis]SPA36273.1 hypothetical protein CBM2637_U50001 [Cupriavidus taiwanensis]SPD37628.1 protein of unknown function [Cupriavidus taiwanensis]SPD61936.1 protein of unknown function [Cupriavidus taiwanensis]